jgi:hypothetical protein
MLGRPLALLAATTAVFAASLDARTTLATDRPDFHLLRAIGTCVRGPPAVTSSSRRWPFSRAAAPGQNGSSRRVDCASAATVHISGRAWTTRRCWNWGTPRPWRRRRLDGAAPPRTRAGSTSAAGAPMARQDVFGCGLPYPRAIHAKRASKHICSDPRPCFRANRADEPGVHVPDACAQAHRQCPCRVSGSPYVGLRRSGCGDVHVLFIAGVAIAR